MRLFGFEITCNKAPPPRLMAAHKQGKAGKWRWLLRDLSGRLVATSSIVGFDNYEESVKALTELSGGFEVLQHTGGD